MTFAEWWQKYSGVSVEPYPDAEDVFMVSGRLLTNGPLEDVRHLSDYMVTNEMLQDHYGPTVFLAPRHVSGPWTRADYMNHRVEHTTYYLGIVDVLGRERIESLVRQIASPARIKQALATDKNLNNIPIAKWDAWHHAVLQAVREHGPEVMALSWNGQALKPRTVCWSLSESICVLKAAARRMAEELP